MTREEIAEKAIKDLKLKHQIQDNDPILAVLELMQIYLNQPEKSPAPSGDAPAGSTAGSTADAPPKTAAGVSAEKQQSNKEFQEAVQHLEKQSKALSAIAQELIEEFRFAKERFKSLKPVSDFALTIITVVSLTFGVVLTCYFTK